MKPVHLLGMSMLMLAAAVLPGRPGSGSDVRRSAARLDFTDGLVIADVCSSVWVCVALGAAALLVDLERIDAPVGIGEGGGIVLHEGVAGARLGGTAAG